MNILLTGHSGFVGKNLLRMLNNEHAIMKCPRKWESHHITEFRPDVIFSLAGEIYDPLKMYQANVQLVQDLLMATQKIQYKAFIHVGSSSEYGRKQAPIKETDNLNPTTWYEGTKAAASMLCAGFAREFQKPVVVARPFSLYGPEDNPKKLIPTLIRAAKTDQKIKLCEANHDYVYIDNFINGLLLLAENGFEYGDVVNFGSGVQTTNAEVASIIERICGIKFKIEQMPPKPYDSMNWSCNSTATFAKYGWSATSSLETGLRFLCN